MLAAGGFAQDRTPCFHIRNVVYFSASNEYTDKHYKQQQRC